jgi:hypothetical protein
MNLLNDAIDNHRLEQYPLEWDHDTITQLWPDSSGKDLWAPVEWHGETYWCLGAWSWTWYEVVP